LVAEGTVARLVEAEEGFFEDGAGGFSHAQVFRKIFGEFLAVAGFGVRADELAEGGLIERIEDAGAVEDGAGRGGGGNEAELFGEEEGVGGAEVGGAEEGVEHELGTGGFLQAVKGDGAEAVECRGEVGVFFVFLAHGSQAEAEDGGVVSGGEVGLDAGEVKGVEGKVARGGEGAEALGEVGLHGVDREPGEEKEGFGVAGKRGEEVGELAAFGGAVVGVVIVEEEIDAGAGARGVVELAEEGEAALSWAVLVEAEAAKAVEGGAIRRRGRTSVPWRRSHASVAGTKPKSSPTPPKTIRPTPSIAVPAPSIRATGAAPS
jgi:hypothetical protein